MRALFIKEISGFFSSLTGYVVITVFLVVNELFIWVFPGNTNILDSGFASLSPLFYISPWIFLFLIPAITMRSFAEEKKAGTLELLLIRPVSFLQIILAKYFSALVLVILALIPTLTYYISIILLGNPVGNIDHGALWGSFIGLLFLAAVYTAIGIFSSSLTDNIIVAFLLGVFICFIAFTGFNYVGNLFPVGGLGNILISIGVDDHYKSISRGVIDSRDLVYFVSAVSVFIIFTNVKLTSKHNKHSQRLLSASFIIISIVLFNIVARSAFFRIDLTSEKRYTISKQTKTILRNLNDVVFIRVYLDGELNIELKQFQKSISEILDELKVYGGNNLEYEFIDPFEGADKKTRDKILEELYNKGLSPVNIFHRKKDGSTTEKIIIPGAVVIYKGIEIPLNLLMNNPAKPSEENLNNSIESLEYTLISTIKNITEENVGKIAFIEGNGEWPDPLIGDILKELSKSFQIDRGKINGKTELLTPYKAVVVAGPVTEFSETDKYALDQYIMQGGKVMWILDGVNVDFDSLANGYSFALPNNVNLDDMLFRYGVRINPNLILDSQYSEIPVNVALANNPPNFQKMPWMYYPLISPPADNFITQNINLVQTRFVSSIDTLGARRNIKKTPLLVTSQYTKIRQVPALVELQEINVPPIESEFNNSSLIVGVLLEGKFESAFKNRMSPSGKNEKKIDESPVSKMIVISDADIIRNDVRQTANGPSVTPLGFDKYTNQTYGNKDFLCNAINYLTDDYNLLSLRGREFKLRLLDKSKIASERLKWQLINILAPLLILTILGIGFTMRRKMKYSK